DIRPSNGAPRASPSASPSTLPTIRSATSTARDAIGRGRTLFPIGTLTGRMDKFGPKHRTCRRVGAPLCGRPNCPSNKRPYPPGMHGRGRKRISEYQTRLVEKQKLRAIYWVNEKQMRRYYELASSHRGVTGEVMIRQ